MSTVEWLFIFMLKRRYIYIFFNVTLVQSKCVRENCCFRLLLLALVLQRPPTCLCHSILFTREKLNFHFVASLFSTAIVTLRQRTFLRKSSFQIPAYAFILFFSCCCYKEPNQFYSNGTKTQRKRDDKIEIPFNVPLWMKGTEGARARSGDREYIQMKNCIRFLCLDPSIRLDLPFGQSWWLIVFG